MRTPQAVDCIFVAQENIILFQGVPLFSIIHADASVKHQQQFHIIVKMQFTPVDRHHKCFEARSRNMFDKFVLRKPALECRNLDLFLPARVF